MKIFIHSGKNGYVGVTSDNEDNAVNKIRIALDTIGLVNEEIDLPLEIQDTDKEHILFAMKKRDK